MKKIYIVGGNGFARELGLYIQDIAKRDNQIVLAGFLGHNGYGDSINYMEMQKFYKGDISNHIFAPDEYVVIGAGYPELRKKIYIDLKKMNAKFHTFCYNCRIGEDVEFGEANIFISSNIISHNIKIGNANLFNVDIMVGHDVEIGDYNFFGPRTSILGSVKIGNYNQVGTNSIFLPHVKVGDNNKFSPLSAIYKGCRNNCYMSGNPALKIGDINE